MIPPGEEQQRPVEWQARHRPPPRGTDDWPARPWGGCVPSPRAQPGSGERKGLILTDPAVWTSETRRALAPIPVITVHTCATVIAAGREGRRGQAQFIIRTLLVNYDPSTQTGMLAALLNITLQDLTLEFPSKQRIIKTKKWSGPFGLLVF